mmetsp:Transcript_56601/g.88084  ORF Transcript_56601/g.88084 Transcript_56601/m.88084 type:complete len:288 (-) Transcript_56601:244-1107(-)
MATELQDWIRNLGQISGDARHALLRAAWDLRWGLSEFENAIVTTTSLPAFIVDQLTPFEVAAIRRAWHADFDDAFSWRSRESRMAKTAPSWEMLGGEPWWSHEHLIGSEWPPPIGDPSWGNPEGEVIGRRPSKTLVSRCRTNTPDGRPQSAHSFRKSDKKGRNDRPSTFACGPVDPKVAVNMDVSQGSPSKMHRRVGAPRRSMSAQCANRSARSRPAFQSPSIVRRSSGMSPWWRESAWSTIPSLECEPIRRELPVAWKNLSAIAGAAVRPSGNFIPEAAVYGRRVL